MNFEVALTRSTKILWANRPAEFQYPPRDIENEWEKSAQRRRKFQFAEIDTEIEIVQPAQRFNWFQELAQQLPKDVECEQYGLVSS